MEGSSGGSCSFRVDWKISGFCYGTRNVPGKWVLPNELCGLRRNYQTNSPGLGLGSFFQIGPDKVAPRSPLALGAIYPALIQRTGEPVVLFILNRSGVLEHTLSLVLKPAASAKAAAAASLLDLDSTDTSRRPQEPSILKGLCGFRSASKARQPAHARKTA